MVILRNLMFCFSLFPDCGHWRIQINLREFQNILKFSKSKCRKEYWEMPFSINTSVINLNLSRDKDSNTIHDEFKGIFCSWWCHPKETFSALLALGAGNSSVTGELPSPRPVTQIFDVFFDLHLNIRLSKQPRHWWIEMPLCSLWHHCNDCLWVIGPALVLSHGVWCYRQVSNISRTVEGNQIVDHSDVVGAAPTLHLHSRFNTWLRWVGQRQLHDETRII